MKCILFIPGIYHDKDSTNEWTDKAVEYVAALEKKKHNQEWVAFRQEYGVGAVFRRLSQDDRAKRTADFCEDAHNSGLEPVLVGHSNGADIIVRAIKRLSTKTQVLSIHLIAGAAQPDFEKNGLNDALKDGRVLNAYVYFSNKDEVLNKAARWSRRLFGWAGLGYGDVGLVGPKNISARVISRVQPIPDHRQDHGSWVGKNLHKKLPFYLR